MVRDSKGWLNKAYLVILSLLVSQCANQLPPGGGEIDRIPPTIVEIYPQDGTTNFTDDYFELGFSEYVEKRSVKEAIFISPAIEGDLELDWSGKYVRVYFPGELKQNITYVITIGTDVQDYNNKNPMEEAMSFTFSTGPEIDRRTITGKIYDSNPRGIMLFGYLLKDEELNPLEIKPDYISQTGKEGNFKLSGLAAGLYRIFGVRDEYRDLIYQPDQDQIGIPFQQVKLGENDTLFSGLNFLLTDIDTVKPRILTVSMTDRNHILVNLSEELHRQNIKSKYFYIIDSTLNKRIPIKYAFKGNTKPSEIVLVTNDSLSINNSVFLFADTIKDKSGNVYLDDFAQITISDREDTTAIELFSAMPENGNKEVDFLNPKFTFDFNDAFDITKGKDAIAFADTFKNKVNFEIAFLDDASFTITPLKRLEMSKDYLISIDMSKLKDIAGNFLDTVYQYQFKTITGLEFTGATGKVLNVDVKKNPKLELKSVEKNDLKYLTSLQRNDFFSFERIIPGKYLLSAYYDRDSSDTYSNGSLNPFKEAEEFSFYPDTLNLRARWTETDIKFEFK